MSSDLSIPMMSFPITALHHVTADPGYAGEVGGGKSDIPLIDALCLQHEGIVNQRHRAILFRRSFPESRELITKPEMVIQMKMPS